MRRDSASSTLCGAAAARAGAAAAVAAAPQEQRAHAGVIALGVATADAEQAEPGGGVAVGRSVEREHHGRADVVGLRAEEIVRLSAPQVTAERLAGREQGREGGGVGIADGRLAERQVFFYGVLRRYGFRAEETERERVRMKVLAQCGAHHL